jgi:hypothetical protein
VWKSILAYDRYSIEPRPNSFSSGLQRDSTETLATHERDALVNALIYPELPKVAALRLFQVDQELERLFWEVKQVKDRRRPFTEEERTQLEALRGKLEERNYLLTLRNNARQRRK